MYTKEEHAIVKNIIYTHFLILSSAFQYFLLTIPIRADLDPQGFTMYFGNFFYCTYKLCILRISPTPPTGLECALRAFLLPNPQSFILYFAHISYLAHNALSRILYISLIPPARLYCLF